jgi:NADH-quinone oxidoreductase subunit C
LSSTDDATPSPDETPATDAAGIKAPVVETPAPDSTTASADAPATDAPAVAPAPEVPVVPVVIDDARETLVSQLRGAIGDALLEYHVKPNDDLWIRVRTDAWVAAGKAVRDVLHMDYFDFLSAMDWMPSPYGRGEDDPTAEPVERSTEIKQGYAGGATRFQIMARVMSSTRHIGLTLKADVDDANPVIASWVPVYRGANWHERECAEMFGIGFAGHPDLRKMYLPIDFEGYPLRKDFPLLARMVKPWPGIVDVEPIPAHLDTDGGDAE